MRFVREWSMSPEPAGAAIYRPILTVLARGREGLVQRDFLVDSGADLAMAPYELCRELGLRWQDGVPLPIQGISRRRTCVVAGRIHDVDIVIPDAGVILRIPMIFARGNAPYVLGRDGLFDVFTITFDAAPRRTTFEMLDL